MTLFHKKHRGFSLIETLVAISILLIAVAGPLTLVARSLSAATYVRDQITAYYLAQEALDVVRSVRDNNSLVSDPWDTDIRPDPCVTGCTVDSFATLTSRLAPCNPADEASCVVLATDVVTGEGETGLRYFHHGSKDSGAPPSIFRRYVTFTPPDTTQAPNTQGEAIITATVTWSSGLIPRTLTLESNVFDWK